jgi:hypothetical protein
MVSLSNCKNPPFWTYSLSYVVRIEQKGTGLAVVPPRLPEEKVVLGPGMKEEKNSLDEGEAVLIWPETLSADSVRDLEYWLTGVLQKAKGRAGIKE